jgi:hypothetical protein
VLGLLAFRSTYQGLGFRNRDSSSSFDKWTSVQGERHASVPDMSPPPPSDIDAQTRRQKRRRQPNRLSSPLLLREGLGSKVQEFRLMAHG